MLSFHSALNQVVLFCWCIKSRGEFSHAPTVAASSAESGGPNDAPERENEKSES